MLPWIAGILKMSPMSRALRPKDRGFLAQVEGLENRWCPSCTATLHAPDLVITCNDAADTIAIRQNDSLNRLDVVIDGAAFTFGSDGISTITADLNGGHDIFTYN